MNKVFLMVVILEVIFLLVPTSLMFIFGMGVSLLGFLKGNAGEHTPTYLYLGGALLIPGYALYSLWWLVFSYRNLTLGTIPVRIWLGLSVGALIAIFIFSPFNFHPPTDHISHLEHFHTTLIFGLGPLLMLVTLLFIMFCQQSSSKPSNMDGDKR